MKKTTLVFWGHVHFGIPYFRATLWPGLRGKKEKKKITALPVPKMLWAQKKTTSLFLSSGLHNVNFLVSELNFENLFPDLSST